MLSIVEICEKIWELEEKHDLLDWEVETVNLWQHYRMDLYYEIAEKTGVFSRPHRETSKKTLKEKLIILVVFFKNFLFHNIDIRIKKHTKIIVIPSERTKWIDGEYVDIYTRPLINQLVKEKKDFQVFVRPFSNTYAKIPNRFTYINFHQTICRFLDKFIDYQFNQKAEEKIRTINQEINNVFGIEVDLKSKYKRYIRFLKRYYQGCYGLFKKIKPEKIVLVCSYGKGSIIKAAKDLGIEVIELQHGTYSKYHLGYSFPYRKKELNYFPTTFYSWGDYWSNLFELPINNENIVNYGFGHFRKIKDSYSDVSRKNNQIVILSQGALSEKLSSIIESQLQYLDGYQVMYKLHPTENAKNYCKFSNYKNITIVEKTDLYKLLAESNYVIGVFSTALFEAIGFGCKPILVDLPGIEYMEKLINDCNIPVLYQNSIIPELVGQANNIKIDTKHLF